MNARGLPVLMLNQGRASDAGVMGHLRAQEGYRLGLSEISEVAPCFETLRAFTRTERLLRTRVPGLSSCDSGPLRWQLARSWAARQRVAAVAASGSHRAVHLTTHVVGLLLGDLVDRLPVVPSVDVPIWEWQKLLRGSRDDAPVSLDMRPAVALERALLKRAPLVTAWTATVRDQVRALAPDAEVVQHHPGIDLDLFRPTSERRPGPLRVLFVGGRFAEKGGPALVEALSPLLSASDVALDVVTPAAVAPRPSLTVHRLRAGSPQLLELFRQADVFCLPSRSDAVPWVVLEALASGTAVVAQRVGSVPELLGDGTAGVLIDSDAPEALSRALVALLDDAPRRRELAAAGRARAELHYDARKQGRQLRDLLAEVVAAG